MFNPKCQLNRVPQIEHTHVTSIQHPGELTEHYYMYYFIGNVKINLLDFSVIAEMILKEILRFRKRFFATENTNS
jgi:hypothetical protein